MSAEVPLAISFVAYHGTISRPGTFDNHRRSNSTMSWKIAITVALLTGIITAVITAPVADRITKAHGVSDFEGGRGMMIAFLLIPAGFIGGVLIGLLCTKLVHAVEWAQFWKAAGLSIGLSLVTLFSIAGLSLLTIIRPPLLEGHELTLQLEVHVPLQHITPQSRGKDKIRMSLYARPKDNQYATIDTANYREEDGMFIVTAHAALNSRSFTRTVSFLIEDHTWLAADLELAGSPGEQDLEWTGLMPMREARTSDGQPATTDTRYRYRVVKGVKSK